MFFRSIFIETIVDLFWTIYHSIELEKLDLILYLSDQKTMGKDL